MDNDCFLGHVCLDKMCLVGCRENTDCPSALSCVNNRCQDPCAGVSCGPNAVCQALDQRATCACRAGFSPNPTAVIGCTREPIRCAGNKQCPENFQCNSGFCKAVCNTDANCQSGELCVSNLCQEICRTDSDCSSGEFCRGVTCVKGCRSHVDCPQEQSCEENKCIGKFFSSKYLCYCCQ